MRTSTLLRFRAPKSAFSSASLPYGDAYSLGYSANERPELEDEDGEEEGPLAVEECEDLAVEEEEGGLGEEVG